MKKTLTLSLLFMALKTQAQITITQSAFPTAGTAWIGYGDNRQAVHTITAPSGTPQTWNYANAFVIDDTSGIAFVTPASTPYASNFPNATLASYDALSDFATYYKGTPNGFYLDGFYDGMGTPPLQNVNFDPDLLGLPVPFTYNNTRNNNAKVEVIQAGPPPIKIVLTIVQQFVCDAFGTLTTPVFSNQQVIRIKQSQYSVDSVFMDLLGNGTWTLLSSNQGDSSLTYAFARNATLPILMEISADPAAPTTSIGATYYESGVSGINENTANSPSVTAFPNPVANGVLKFKIEDPSAVQLSLFDLAGKQVYQTSVAGVNTLTVYTSTLQSGAYLFKVTDKDNQIIQTGKVMVAKN